MDFVYARGGRSCERYSAVRSNGFHVAAHSQKSRLVFLTQSLHTVSYAPQFLFFFLLFLFKILNWWQINYFNKLACSHTHLYIMILPSKSLKRWRPRHPWFLQTRSMTRIHRVGSVHFPRCFQVSYVSMCVWEYPAVSPSLARSLFTHWCVLRVSALETRGCCLRKCLGGARASSPLLPVTFPRSRSDRYFKPSLTLRKSATR